MRIATPGSCMLLGVFTRHEDGQTFDVDLTDYHYREGEPNAHEEPPHPGETVKDACLEPLNLSVTKGAELLGVTRGTLSRVLNGRVGISPEMAVRLEKMGWSTADHWLRRQMAYDIDHVRQRESKIKVKRYEPAAAALCSRD